MDQELAGDVVVETLDVGLKLAVPAHDQAKDGSLDPSHAQDTLIAHLAGSQSIGTGEVIAVELVSHTAGLSSRRETCKLPVVAQVLQGLAHDPGVVVIDEQALDRQAAVRIAEDLIDEQLPFFVSVSRVDDAFSLLQ